MKILIADKFPIYRLGLLAMLEKEFPNSWLTECENKEDLIKASGDNDVIIFNQDQFSLSPEEIKSIEKSSIILTSQDKPLSGICCRILKPDCKCSGIIKNIKELFPDHNAINKTILSEREIEILQLVAQGNTNKAIADILCLSPHTIHTHRKNILRKLHLKSASELTIYAIKEGYLDRIP